MKEHYESKDFKPDTLGLIAQAERIIQDYQQQGYSLTLRQLYYQFVSRALIPNTEKSYKRIGNVISDARRAGMLDWNAIEDRTRNLSGIGTWDTPQEILVAARDGYHRDLWAYQDTRVEVWVEKEALAGVVYGISSQLDVPHFSCRGYVSDSEMWRAGRRIIKHNKDGYKVLILHLGDHDPSGIDMTRDIKDRLAMFSRYGDFEVKRIALTMEQIEDQSPPPNPAKVTDSRYESYLAVYGTESWELDALEPRFITQLIEEHVLEVRDDEEYQRAIDEQEAERAKIARVVKEWDNLFKGGE